jgi:membrane protein
MAPLLRFSGMATRLSRGVWLRKLALQTWKGVLADRLFGHAAELGFYFAFALFPTLLCGATILGFAVRSAHQISDELLENLALVIPHSALAMVLNTFNQTAAAASSGKLTLGSVVAVWSASVGVSAIQDTLNAVFKIEERRSYVVARIQAILLTLLLIGLVGAGLGCMVFADFVAALAERRIVQPVFAIAMGVGIRIVAWAASSCLLALSFAILYYWAPDWRQRRWRWLTPGTVLGIAGWLLASIGFRVYLAFFNSFTLTYGSLGAMIILLMWFYISGLMLLVGAEFDFVMREATADARVGRMPARRNAYGNS